jgi:prepilin-type N-terminal cleavage/methylation domain-containing protein
MKRTRLGKQPRGFTLIELLIVIAIILILIAIALPNFLEAQIRAKVTKARAEARTIATAMDSYFLDWRMYPPDHDPNNRTQQGLLQLTSPLTYLTSLPIEPFAQNSGMIDDQGEVNWEMGSSGLTPIQATVINVKANIHAFNIESFGPDVDDDWSGNDDWPFCGGRTGNPCQQGGCNWMNYSPTNGTKSNGDLMHSGGEYRNGSYCVDGWQHIRGRMP